MLFKNTSILFLILLISFCSCKKDVKPQLPMDEDKVVSLLGDIHFAKSAAKIHQIEIRDSVYSIYESQVLLINGVTKKEYNQLMYILESNLKQYYDIEKKVHSYLKTVQNEKIN